MKKMKPLVALSFLLISLTVFCQDKDKKAKEATVTLDEKELIRKGNAYYNQQDFTEAEGEYKKALEQNPAYEKANYNLGNAVYQQKKYKEALPMYQMVAKTADKKINKAESFHNMGNTFMKEKQYQQAVEAFKNSLRNNPNDDETRYNLALAQKMLKDQQNQQNKDNKNQQNQNKNQDQNKDQQNKDNKNQDNKNDQNKDKQDQNKDNKDQNKDQQDQNKDKQDQNKDNKDNQDKNKQDQNKDQQQNGQPQPNQLSPQQVKQLLEAMNNEENKTQQKINAKKGQHCHHMCRQRVFFRSIWCDDTDITVGPDIPCYKSHM